MMCCRLTVVRLRLVGIHVRAELLRIHIGLRLHTVQLLASIELHVFRRIGIQKGRYMSASFLSGCPLFQCLSAKTHRTRIEVAHLLSSALLFV